MTTLLTFDSISYTYKCVHSTEVLLEKKMFLSSKLLSIQWPVCLAVKWKYLLQYWSLIETWLNRNKLWVTTGKWVIVILLCNIIMQQKSADHVTQKAPRFYVVASIDYMELMSRKCRRHLNILSSLHTTYCVLGPSLWKKVWQDCAEDNI